MVVELDPKLVFAHYNRPPILAEMVRCSQKKEVVGSFGGQGYAKRPNVIEYPADILAEVKRGVTSFHASEELWSNALNINTELSKADVEKLRIGWDLLLDIDCKEFEYSRIAAAVLVDALFAHGIQNVSVKFSGNHGFHIVVPFESFPTQYAGKNVSALFPEAPRNIAQYLKHICAEKVTKGLVEFEGGNLQSALIQFKEKAALSGSVLEKIQQNFDPFEVVGIDTILISSRHLYRQVYSINEKSGLISLPINPRKILQFDKSIAKIENQIVSKFKFLEREKSIPGEASALFTHAYDYCGTLKAQEESTKFYTELTKKESIRDDIREKIPQEFFPPSITNLLKPLGDGKKRAMFILINFLRGCNYSNEEIELMLSDWNKQHLEPLRDTYFKGQIKHGLSGEFIPPPNVDNSVYEDISGVKPTDQERKFKNPLAIAKTRFRYWQMENQKPKRVKKEKQKSETAPKKKNTPITDAPPVSREIPNPNSES